MMNAQIITKLLFSSGAQLAGEVVALSNLRLESFAETRRVWTVSNAALPVGISFAGQGFGDTQKPVTILSLFFSTNPSGFAFFKCPTIGDFLAGGRCMLPSPPALHTFLRLAHFLFLFWCALIGRASFLKSRVARWAAFNTTANRRFAINAKVGFLVIYLLHIEAHYTI